MMHVKIRHDESISEFNIKPILKLTFYQEDVKIAAFNNGKKSRIQRCRNAILTENEYVFFSKVSLVNFASKIK